MGLLFGLAHGQLVGAVERLADIGADHGAGEGAQRRGDDLSRAAADLRADNRTADTADDGARGLFLPGVAATGGEDEGRRGERRDSFRIHRQGPSIMRTHF
jgi:hypothetical protein